MDHLEMIFHRSIITAELWRPEVARHWKNWDFLRFLEKWPLMGKFSKFYSDRIHHDTDGHAVLKFHETWLTEIGKILHTVFVRSKVNPVFGWILASSRIKIHEKQNLQTLKTNANTNKLAKLRTHKKLVKAKPTTVCKNRWWLSFKEWRTVVNSTPQNSSINLPTYSLDNHHCLYTA